MLEGEWSPHVTIPAAMPLTQRKGDPKQAKPAGTARKVARRDQPLLCMKRTEVERRAEALAAERTSFAAEKEAFYAEKTAFAAEKATLASLQAAENAAMRAKIENVEKSASMLAADVSLLEKARATLEYDQQKMEAKAALENITGTNGRKRLKKQDSDEAQAIEAREMLKPRMGAILEESQSRMILLLYFELVQSGHSSNVAARKTACTMRVGVEKVLKIRSHWFNTKELLTTSGKGRGAARSEDDGRKALTSEQRVQLETFIGDKREKGERVIRRDVAQWIEAHCNHPTSARAAGSLMQRLGITLNPVT